MTISDDIGKELDRQANRDRHYLPQPHFGEVAQGGSDAEPHNVAGVIELCEAEQAAFRYWRAEQSFKEALQALEVALYPFQEDMRHQEFRGTERQAIYNYLRTMFSKPIEELKAARKQNAELGDFTGRKVAECKTKLNPEIHRQAKEQHQEAERATVFCESFLNWISKYEEPVTGETK